MNITTQKLTEVVRKHHQANPSNRDIVVSLHLSEDGFGKIEIVQGYLEPQSRAKIKYSFSPINENEIRTNIKVRNPKIYLLYFAKPIWTRFNREPYNLQGYAYIPYRKSSLKLIETSYVKQEDVDYKNFGEYNEEYNDMKKTVRNIFQVESEYKGMFKELVSLRNWNKESVQVDFIIQKNLTSHFLTDIFKILDASDYASAEIKDSLNNS